MKKLTTILITLFLMLVPLTAVGLEYTKAFGKSTVNLVLQPEESVKIGNIDVINKTDNIVILVDVPSIVETGNFAAIFEVKKDADIIFRDGGNINYDWDNSRIIIGENKNIY